MNTHYYQAPPPQGAAKISGGLLAGIATVMIIVVIAAALVAYNAGYRQGRSDYMHNNCTYYPFLLLKSNQYWASRIPADQLSGGQ